ADQKYDQYRREVDFIQHYIFPGGFLPSLTAIANTLTQVTDLRIFHLEDIGAHYATTLRHWRERFLANLDRVRALGFPETFIRMWDYYLCYCEGGFRERTIGAVQVLMTKPLCRREPVTPTLA
ncbi:MAG: class I SAM-dependent methyltransferase, partial [Planctomycetaceae bacterium]|nr:class I SAM-dependent methyltransferase [Planctomycetaceae bacterium]